MITSLVLEVLMPNCYWQTILPAKWAVCCLVTTNDESNWGGFRSKADHTVVRVVDDKCVGGRGSMWCDVDHVFETLLHGNCLVMQAPCVFLRQRSMTDNLKHFGLKDCDKFEILVKTPASWSPNTLRTLPVAYLVWWPLWGLQTLEFSLSWANAPRD